MDQMDGTTLGNHLIKLNLISPEQWLETQEELGVRNPDKDALLRTLERKNYLTPWQTSKILKGDTAGFLLGGYRILYKIASGSFGRVFRAEDPHSGRIVAVKVLRRRWSEEKAHIDLFMREGEVGLTLKHPGIVEVLAMSHDAAAGQYYIVMEFVEGGNLREILQIRKRLSAKETMKIAENTVGGLAFAYSKGITHRDIKMTNILVSSSGTAKLVDFGLAQIFEQMGQEQKDRVDRTVDYAGLEKATGVPHGDVRSDIYFLGAVFYECLSGRSPLEMTRDKHARMQRQRFESVKSLKPGEVDAPPSVLQLIENMMSLDPARRFQTPSQLVDATASVLRELEGKGPAGQTPSGQTQQSIFIVEGDERLQDALRTKFKNLGYRVFLAADPQRALDRYRQQAFDFLIVDAGTTDEQGLFVFDHILTEAASKKHPTVGILVLSEEQADWKERVVAKRNSAILTRPITLKQLTRTLEKLLERNK